MTKPQLQTFWRGPLDMDIGRVALGQRYSTSCSLTPLASAYTKFTLSTEIVCFEQLEAWARFLCALKLYKNFVHARSFSACTVVGIVNTHTCTHALVTTLCTCFNVSDVYGSMAVLVSRARAPVSLHLVQRAVRSRTAVRFRHLEAFVSDRS